MLRYMYTSLCQNQSTFGTDKSGRSCGAHCTLYSKAVDIYEACSVSVD